MKSTEPTFVDLFSGAGGLSLGLQNAGWKGVAAFDNWSDAVCTYNESRMFDHRAHCMSVAELTGQTLRQLISDTPDWIVGGPPCQGYSTVGKRDRNDPKNRLFEEFARIVKRVQPQGFIIENVLGMRDMSFIDEVRNAFKQNYCVTAHVLTAAEHGVPQLRRRVIFVGHRESTFQGWTSGSGDVSADPDLLSRDEFVTVEQAIFDLPEVGPGETKTEYDRDPSSDFQKAMRGGHNHLQGHTVSKHPSRLVRAISHISDGGNRTEIPRELQPSSGFHNTYSRLNSKEPAVAVTSNLGKPSGSRCIHPKQHRGLTAREGARLQTFPDRFYFRGGIVSQRLQIANAVPPLLATSLARALSDERRWT